MLKLYGSFVNIIQWKNDKSSAALRPESHMFAYLHMIRTWGIEGYSPLKKIFNSGCLLLIIFPFIFPPMNGFAEQVVIDENFNTLDDWEAVTFSQIERHSEYHIQKTETGRILVASSDASASGIRYKNEFNVYDSPVVRWRWKVDNVYSGGSIMEKSGNDYPMRVYIMFKYDPEAATFAEKNMYGLVRMVSGEYPPHSSLNYIWANKPGNHLIYSSPYTDRSKLIILRSGEAEAGRWVDEEVNIIDDYKKAFGTPPPAMASISVMNDSDNTGESSVSYLDYIQVLKKE